MSNGDAVSAAAVQPASLDQAVLVTLEIGYLVKKKAVPQDMDAQELTALFQKRFGDQARVCVDGTHAACVTHAVQVLNGNLEMSMEFIGTNYLIKVVGILKIDDSGEQVPVLVCAEQHSVCLEGCQKSSRCYTCSITC